MVMGLWQARTAVRPWHKAGYEDSATLPPVADLSPARNARLRKAMWKACNERHDGKITPFSDTFDVSQPVLSRFLNQGGGASLQTAEAFAKLIGVEVTSLLGPVDRQPGEDLDLGTKKTSTVDPSASQFLGKLTRHAGLYDLILEHEGRWRISTVVHAVHAATGEPAGGWMALLDQIEAGDDEKPKKAPKKRRRSSRRIKT